jgi:hypothetical protein
MFVGCLTSYIFTIFSGRSIRDDGILTDLCLRNESDPTDQKV